MDYAVIGAQFGDEGKGLVTDYLCSKLNDPIVVRYSGGSQAGHTVWLKDVKHVFSHFGSGTLRGVPTYWSSMCVTNPVALVNEYKILVDKGFNPKIYINGLSPIVTPYDIAMNQIDNNTLKHGTCGLGINSTKRRREKKYSLDFEDLFSETILKIKMELINDFYVGLTPDLDNFYYSIRFIINNPNIINVSVCPYFENTVRESSQGLLLDQNIGFFPHVTPSNLGWSEPYESYLVTRAYQTRHGNGVMTNTHLPHNIKIDPDETNKNNRFQGEFRVSLLDLDLIRYAIWKHKSVYRGSFKNLVITCLDHIENEYRFTHEQKIINCNDEKDFINKVAFILGFKNVFISKSKFSENIRKWNE